MRNDYQRTGDTSRQGHSMKVEAWDQANVVAPATLSKVTTAGGLYVSASAWQDAPTGPPKKLIGKFVERTETAFANLPIPVNDGCSLSSSGCTDWKKRYARQYN